MATAIPPTVARGPGPAPGYLDQRHCKTGPDGRYSFPPQDEPFGILVVHDKGFGDRTREEMAQSPDVTLKPWARIEGTFRIRGTPGIHQRDRRQPRFARYFRADYRFQSYSVTTDDQGRFVIDRILDGEANFTWLSGRRPTMTESSAGPAVDVRSGQTVHVDLGGPGRPLIGQVVLSAPDEAKAADRLTRRPRRQRVRLAPDQALPDADSTGLPDLGREEAAAYKIKWYHTEPGRAYMRTRRFHLFYVGADGRFRIEDVVPGSYTLSIGVASTPGITHPLTRNRFEGRIERDVEVGPIPGGHSEEPLDLGKIPLKLEREN